MDKTGHTINPTEINTGNDNAVNTPNRRKNSEAIASVGKAIVKDFRNNYIKPERDHLSHSYSHKRLLGQLNDMKLK